MDATAIYYTFSTIAQTLAGALAVLVAFTVFRLAKLDETIRTGKTELTRYSDWPRRWEALRVGGLKGLEDDLGTRVDLPQRTVYHEAFVAVGQRPRMLRALGWALTATVSDIALCFIALPLTPLMASQSALVRGAAVSIPVAGGIICLGLYWWLVQTMLYPPRPRVERPVP